MSARLIVALDYADERRALQFVDEVGDACDFYKVGLELFSAAGPAIVGALLQRSKRVFLDLKLHDIPNTVRSAARNAAGLGCSLITVHVAGGGDMLRAALHGAKEGGGNVEPTCRVLGVSVLTSLDAAQLAAVWGRGDIGDVSVEVLRLATLAAESGLHGLVCGGHEAGLVRARHGGSLELLVPGIRLEGGASHDQARVVTPRVAQDAGADYLVLGRAVTQSGNPAAVLGEIRRSLQ